MITAFNKILISRTDNIGDVVLTIPMAGILKKFFPDTKVAFLGKTYTKSIIESSTYIDEFYNWDDLIQDPVTAFKGINADAIIHVYPDKVIAKAAKKSGIKIRVGTSHRAFHWFTCNKLINLGRKNSDLHEAQLNSILLKGLGINFVPSVKEIPAFYGMRVATLNKAIPFFDNGNFNLILHIKSKGSGKEWRPHNFYNLAKELNGKGFNIYITGTEQERALIVKDGTGILDLPNVIDVTGRFSLPEFISFIKSSDGLLACSTGPLHIASSLEKQTLGLYAPPRPIHPGRWAPVGKHASFLVADKYCKGCKSISDCDCINSITVSEVLQKILSWKKKVH